VEKKNTVYKCRVCYSDKIKNFKINHFGFVPKNEDWKSFFCFNCGSVSEFRIRGKYTSYTDGSYKNHSDIEDDDINVFPPIDFWSSIAFKRWRNVFNILNESTAIFKKKNIKMLDFGGYNGFLPYAINQKCKTNSFVADYDKKGLKMAKFLGSQIVDLSESKIEEKNFDLITIVHVLEHLHWPKEQLKELKNNLSSDGVIYAEVPNLYAYPLADESHTIAFSMHSLLELFRECGFKITNFGYTKTSIESIKFDYYHNSETENLFLVGFLNGNYKKITHLPIAKIPNNIKSFKYDLQLSYAKIMIKSISINLFKTFLRYLRTSILFLVYGLVELITLKIFKISLINNFLKKK